MAFASARNGGAPSGLKIKFTGSGTFVAPASGGESSAVRGGGTWETFANDVSTAGGTYKVTGLASWQFANLQTPGLKDQIGDVNQRANGTAVLRQMIDGALKDVGDWTNTASGDIDWIKCKVVNGTRVCVGVEVQMSARSDLIFRDIVHFQKQLREGQIDICVEILPSDAMSYYLTDRTPCFSDGVRVIQEMLADNLPIVLMAIENDGWADTPLTKKKTNLGIGQRRSRVIPS